MLPDNKVKMKQIFVVLCLFSMVSPNLIGIDCDRKENNQVLESCEILEVNDFNSPCPLYIESQCNEKILCLCEAKEYSLPCLTLRRCIWSNSTVVPDILPEKSQNWLIFIYVFPPVFLILVITIITAYHYRKNRRNKNIDQAFQMSHLERLAENVENEYVENEYVENLIEL